MNTMRQKLLVLALLMVLLVNGGGFPVQASASTQVDARNDAYAAAAEDGFIYVVGDAVNMAAKLPPGSLNHGGGMLDIWVAKLRPDGTPVFQALIGGKADETAFAVAVQQGVIYILGETWSNDFPQAPGSAGEDDAVVLALSADGSQVLWARRFGGSDQDSGRAIAIWQNDLYLTGITWSRNFLPGAAKGDADGFLARLDSSGALNWVKVFGGLDLDAPFGLAARQDSVWVTGQTFSPNLTGSPLGGGDVFALRFDASGAQQFGGLYGGRGDDAAYAAKLSADGSLYLTGETRSSELPGAKGQFGGVSDGFFMHISADGSLLATSYLGGADLDAGSALEVLPNGDALVSGATRSATFPTGFPVSANGMGGEDAFLAQVSPDGTVAYAGVLGSTGDDDARAVALTSDTVALVGAFSAGTLPYYLAVPAGDLPGMVLPTAAPSQPTATLAPTATPQPTETPMPTGDALAILTPTTAALAAESTATLAAPAQEAGSGITPTAAVETGSSGEQPTAAVAAATRPGEISQGESVTRTMAAPQSPATEKQDSGFPVIWVAVIGVLVVFGAIIFLFSRRNRPGGSA